MGDGETPEDQVGDLPSSAPEEKTARSQFTRQLAVYTALLIYVLTPLTVIILFGVRIANLVPFWVLGVVPLLFFANFFFLPNAEEMSLHKRGSSFLDRPRPVLQSALLTAVTALVFAFGAYAFFHWAATSFPLMLQVFILGYIGLILFIAFPIIFSTERGRQWTMRTWTVQAGLYAPPALLAAMIVCTTSLFASVTFILQHHHVVQLHAVNGVQLTVDNISAFYIWHFLDSVPFLEVTKTLKWAEPIKYQDTVTGMFVVGYKAALILPVIAMFVQFWKAIGRASK